MRDLHGRVSREVGRGNGAAVVIPDADGAETDAEHVGLLGMSARAALIGAVLELDAAPDRGTVVRLPVPIAYAEGERESA